MECSGNGTSMLCRRRRTYWDTGLKAQCQIPISAGTSDEMLPLLRLCRDVQLKKSCLTPIAEPQARNLSSNDLPMLLCLPRRLSCRGHVAEETFEPSRLRRMSLGAWLARREIPNIKGVEGPASLLPTPPTSKPAVLAGAIPGKHAAETHQFQLSRLVGFRYLQLGKP